MIRPDGEVLEVVVVSVCVSNEIIRPGLRLVNRPWSCPSNCMGLERTITIYMVYNNHQYRLQTVEFYFKTTISNLICDGPHKIMWWAGFGPRALVWFMCRRFILTSLWKWILYWWTTEGNQWNMETGLTVWGKMNKKRILSVEKKKRLSNSSRWKSKV